MTIDHSNQDPRSSERAEGEVNRWELLYAPGQHPAIAFDYHQLPGASKPHLQEYEMPDGTARVLRIELGYHDQDEIQNYLIYLASLRRHGVATLVPEVQIAADGHGKDNLYVTVDKIEHPTHFDEVLRSKDSDGLRAYDRLAVKLVNQIVESCESEGWVHPDNDRLDQYVIDNSRSIETDNPIGVDVMPVWMTRVKFEEEEIAWQPPLIKKAVGVALSHIAEDVIRIGQAVGDNADLDAMNALRMALENPSVIEFTLPKTRELILGALEVRDVSPFTVREDE